MTIRGWEVIFKDVVGNVGIFCTRRRKDSQDHIGLYLEHGFMAIYGMDLWEGAPYDVFLSVRFFYRDPYFGWHKVKINSGWHGKFWGWGIPWNRAKVMA